MSLPESTVPFRPPVPQRSRARGRGEGASASRLRGARVATLLLALAFLPWPALPGAALPPGALALPTSGMEGGEPAVPAAGWGMGFAAPLRAQIPEGVEGTFRPHPEAEKAISRLLSPFCPGFMLSQCPAAESLALRDSIQALALEGWNADALEAWMLRNHGEEYRAVPQRSGAGLLAWILPPLALLLGVGAVGTAIRRLRGPTQAPPSLTAASGAGQREGASPGGVEGDADDPEVEARLREAIRDLEFSEDPVY